MSVMNILRRKVERIRSESALYKVGWADNT